MILEVFSNLNDSVIRGEAGEVALVRTSLGSGAGERGRGEDAVPPPRCNMPVPGAGISEIAACIPRRCC